MTMTVHALAGAALGSGLERIGGLNKGRLFLIAAISALGHVFLDFLPHGHLAPLLDLSGLGFVLAVVLRLAKSRAALVGLAAAVLPDAFHLLPIRLDPFHGLLATWCAAHPRALLQVVVGGMAFLMILSLQAGRKTTPPNRCGPANPQHAGDWAP